MTILYYLYSLNIHCLFSELCFIYICQRQNLKEVQLILNKFINFVGFLGAGGGIMALIVKRIMTGIFDGHWSLLTTINGGLTGMVRKLVLNIRICRLQRTISFRGLSVCFLFVCLFVFFCFFVVFCLFVCLLCLFVCLFVCFPVSLSVHLTSVCLSTIILIFLRLIFYYILDAVHIMVNFTI